MNAAQAETARWMPGMLDTEGNRYQWRHENRQVEACIDGSEGVAVWTEPSDLSSPDQEDPATRGCMLEAFREAASDPHARVRWSVSRQMWCLVWRTPCRAPELGPDRFVLGATEGEAIAAGLRHRDAQRVTA